MAADEALLGAVLVHIFPEAYAQVGVEGFREVP